MNLKTFAASFVMAAGALSLPALAQSHSQLAHSGHGSGAAKEDHSAHESGKAGSSQVSRSQAAVLVEGEVRKVDREAQKVTLRHGAIPNLDMSPMTMVFRVANASMLESVKTGDKVIFAAERVGGDLTVTRIEPAK